MPILIHDDFDTQIQCEEMEGFIPTEEDYDREPMTNCCGASFVHPDSDLCSACYEHADVFEDDKD